MGTGGQKPADEDRLDEALRESFPASDPVAVGHSDHPGAPPHDAVPAAEADLSKEVEDRPDLSRFQLVIEGEVAAAYYRMDGDRLVLTHTEVPQALSGRGIGSALARGVFEALHARGQKVVTQCPFMAKFASRHPEYRDIVVG